MGGPLTSKTLFSRERSSPAPSQLLATECVAARGRAVFFNAEIAETAEIVHCAIGTKFTRATTEGTEDTEGERCKRPRGPGGATPWALRALRSAPRLGPRDLRSRVPCATLRSPGQLPGAQGITSVVEGKNKTQSAQDRPAPRVPDEPGAKRTGRRAGEERGRGAPEAVKLPG